MEGDNITSITLSGEAPEVASTAREQTGNEILSSIPSSYHNNGFHNRGGKRGIGKINFNGTNSGYQKNGFFHNNYFYNDYSFEENGKKKKFRPFDSFEKRNQTNLDDAQMAKLEEVLNREIAITSKDGSSVLYSTPRELIRELYTKCLFSHSKLLKKNSIRLTGSGAAYILSDGANYKDLDFTFYIQTPSFNEILLIEEQVVFDLVTSQQQNQQSSQATTVKAQKSSVESSAPEPVISNNAHSSSVMEGKNLVCKDSFLSNPSSLREVYDKYFLDSIKIDSPDNQWSLITLGKKGSLTIDIKFVLRSKRSYVFSSDSFEIILDPLFDQKRVRKKIIVESLFGDLPQALDHLRNHILFTKNPSEIRLGLFRYCYERCKGKHPVSIQLEQEFVSSFLIEMKEMHSTFEELLNKFLQKHFPVLSWHEYLQELYKILQQNITPEQDCQQYLSVLEKFMKQYS